MWWLSHFCLRIKQSFKVSFLFSYILSNLNFNCVLVYLLSICQSAYLSLSVYSRLRPLLYFFLSLFHVYRGIGISVHYFMSYLNHRRLSVYNMLKLLSNFYPSFSCLQGVRYLSILNDLSHNSQTHTTIITTTILSSLQQRSNTPVIRHTRLNTVQIRSCQDFSAHDGTRGYITNMLGEALLFLLRHAVCSSVHSLSSNTDRHPPLSVGSPVSYKEWNSEIRKGIKR